VALNAAGFKTIKLYTKIYGRRPMTLSALAGANSQRPA